MAPTKLHNIKLKHVIYMCNYDFPSVKPLSQKSLANYSFSYQVTTLESKGTQELLVWNAET